MTATRASSGRSGLQTSIFAKAAALVALTTIAVAAMVLFSAQRSAYGIVHQHLVDLMIANTDATAGSIGGHIKFGKVDSVMLELENHADKAAEHFVAIGAWDASGTQLADIGATDAATRAEMARLAQDARDTGEIAVNHHDMILAIPVIYRDGQVTGAVGAVWTPAGLYAEMLIKAAPAMALTGLAFLALLGLATFLLRRMIGLPLHAVSDAMTQVSRGDYDAAIPMTESHDEVGVIARSLDALRDRLQHAQAADAALERARADQADAVQRLGKGLTALAAGDLTQPIETAFAAEYEQLRHDFNATMSTLNEMLAAVVENATEIRGRAEEIAGASDDLSHRTETQAATLEETAAALDELTGSVRSAAEGAAEVEGVVRSARGDAEASGRVVSDAVDAMGEIKRSSDEISQIIGVIDDIAFQTNLLALNAGVEAARAGEAGRGFAVVASEVRALAQRSSEAAREIKELISASSGQVESGVALVNRAGEALSDIVGRVGNIADLVSEIATGAQEQSVGLGEINVGVTQLDQVTQQNAAMVEEATAASATLRHEAETLQGLVARFRLKTQAAQSPGAMAPLRLVQNSAADAAPEKAGLSFPAQKRAAQGQADWQDF
ncbi:methyl-accepting chemotaxis protein [Rhodovulum sp. ES.010]|uniref:methyl-accepting chemotaxis protein n=1 Tax=Rhodovulum sp. ES.010 TaxID=1882821 RepID=UPI000925F894|nr:methyl-accepting chemotaxis protein [Rhodovulum sp. ES.010]SIO04475.1 methyl-accepting chemotaxis protein [Rhodovulum sp. ES.010]